MTRRRVGILRIMHESNSFNPVKTDLDHFRAMEGILIGDEVLGPNSRSDEITGFLRVLSACPDDVEIVPLLSASGFAGGNIAQEVVTYLDETLRRLLRQAGPLDGLLVALHGAMASDQIDDLESHFLAILRDQTRADIPLVCTLDCHAVVTRKMMDLASVITAYKTHPHVDIEETGERAARILLRLLRGRIRPVRSWVKVPMLIPPPDDGTHSGPMKMLFDLAGHWSSTPGMIDCSVCCSMCWLDVPEQGWTLIAIADGDASQARRIANDLGAWAWAHRGEFVPEPTYPPREAIRRACLVEGGPVVLTDSADTTGAGCPGDNTVLLEALLAERSRVPGLILHHIPDADAIRAITAKDVGTRVALRVGGKGDTRFCRPVSVEGTVSCVTDGTIEDVGKFTAMPMIDVGKTVCLAVDNLRLVLTERIVIGPQPSLFRKVGIEPFEARIVALKTGVGYKPTYGHVAKAVIRTDCPGSASYNLNNFEFARVPRPLYPLDPNMEWKADQQGA
jgi:microcystin degradation protein MlrC